ncbi:MAG TPA: GAF domain-containing protein [Leptolyngbyaceae cyanobacterium]
MTDISEYSQPMHWQELLIQAKLHLLIVDDVQADIELMVIALETDGITFTYNTAETLNDCQQLLTTQTYDAVLSDYRLPQFTAYQVLQLLQQFQPEIPLVLVTGNLGEEAAVDCIKAGMTDYVLKERLFRLPMVLARSLQEFELRRQQQQAMVRIQIQAQQEAIINRITQAMRETLMVDRVLQITADMLHQALSVSRCLIFQPDSQGQMSIYNVSAATVEREKFIRSECCLYPHYKEKLAQGEPVVINQIEATPLAIQAIAKECAFCSLIIAPLLYQQSFLGGIILHQCDRKREWTEDEISLIKAISAQCAIAIHQAQLFNKIQQQAAREQTLNQISKTLNSSLDPEYILQEIARLTGECFGIDRLIIFSVETEQIQVLNEWRANNRVSSMLNHSFPISDWVDILDPACEFYSKRRFHAPDYAKLPLNSTRRMMIEQGHTLSILSVPIFIRDRLFGGIGLHTTTTYRTFIDDEIHLLQQIADQAAIALYNAQSYERLEELVQQRTQELEQEKLLSDAANRAKSEFLSTISHELRTPLTGILGFSGVLNEQIFGSLNPKQKQYIDCIHSCGKHLLALINDLLDFSKIEAGKEELNLENIVLEEMGQACLSLFEERCSQRGLQLSMEIAPDLSTCNADQRRLKQILVNLLSNAVKFTDSGSITLKIKKAGEQLLFCVSDTGIGIAASDRELIFQPFHQIDSGLNRKYEGTGLGLALSRKLAQLHNGDITLDSELGRGSCFTLHLPILPLDNNL